MPTRSLRSADQLSLNVPKTKRKLRGDHAFAVAAPKLWNDLPLSIRQASSLSLFKSTLKHIFSLAFDIWCWYLVNYFISLLSLNVFYLYFMSCMSFISLYSTLVHFCVFKCFINTVWLIDWLIRVLVHWFYPYSNKSVCNMSKRESIWPSELPCFLYTVHLIYHCSANFHWQNPVNSIRIRYSNRLKLVMLFQCAYQQKAAWFESEFCMNDSSYVITLLKIDNGSLTSKVSWTFC